MKSKNVNGEITLSKEVYKDIVGIAISKLDVFVPIKKETKYIDIDYDDSNLEITIHVRIKQGVDVVSNCNELQNEIFESIKLMTGIEAKKINIDIVGFEK